MGIQAGVLNASEKVDSPKAVEKEIGDFGLFTHEGDFFHLYYHENDPQVKAIVLFVQGNGCPLVRKRIPHIANLSKKYAAKGIKFLMLNSSYQDTREDVIEEAKEYKFPVPVLIDEDQLVGEMLDLKRTTETLLIDTSDWKIKFRGPIDDRLNYEKELPVAKNSYLEDALTSFLSGSPIKLTSAPVKGCKISFPDKEDLNEDPPQFAKDIAPILKQKCVTCHTKGGIGSFAMTSHRKVRGWSDMIEEVVMTERMPPWQADPHYGKFDDNIDLTIEEKQKLIHWVRSGAKMGQGEDDPLKSYRPELIKWPLGEPQHVVNIPEQKVPAEGIIDYRYIVMDNPFTEDTWVGGVHFQPGNTKVLHHIIAYIQEFRDGEWKRSGFLSGYAPGATPKDFPLETGKLLKKNQRFLFELHYTSCGTAEVDNSTMGLYILPQPPIHLLEGGLVIDQDFKIKPNDRNFKWTQSVDIEDDITLFSMNPHMHLRGKAMKYVVELPDKSQKTILSVPLYNFNWQRDYHLSKPLEIPKGSKLIVHAAWDNSALNPSNPAPEKEIGWGRQSFDEMFFATFSYVKGHNYLSDSKTISLAE